MKYIISTSVLFAFLLIACSSPTWLDEGLMIREGRGGLVTLHRDPEDFLVTVAVDGVLTHPDVVPAALSWCDDRVGRDVFTFDESIGDGHDVAVVFSEGLVPGEYDENGGTYDLTTVDYDLDTGRIVHVEVILSADFAYDREVMLQTARHAALHALGLEDDPGPPETVDLRSIMSDPLDPLGDLTDHDREIILEMMGE